MDNVVKADYTSNGEIEIDLKDLFYLIISGIKKTLIFAVIIAVVFSLAFSYLAYRNYVPVYQASADFIINVSNNFGSGVKEYNISTTRLLADTFPYIMESGILSRIVANELGYEALPGTISASAQAEANIFTLTVTAQTSDAANKMLKSAIENYPEVADYVVGDTVFTLLDENLSMTSSNSIDYGGAVFKGGIAGVAALALSVMLYIATNSTVRSVDDIRKILNYKCLSTIPRIHFKKRNKDKSNRVLYTSEKVSPQFREAIRLLTTRVENEATGKKILITSSVPKEGKTTLSINLALSLASRGHKVILVDCDLRNPSVAEFLGVTTVKHGLGDYLNGDATLTNLGFRIPDMNGLVVIPGYGSCSNASEIISSPKMKYLLKNLERMADYIILDSTPCSLLADASILAEYADDALYVVRYDYASKDRILEGIELLSESQIKMLGCVLNIAEYHASGYGGYYYGKYSGKYGRYHKYGGYSHYGYGSYGKSGYYGKK